MAKAKSSILLIEVCGALIAQSGALVLREPAQVAAKVVPVAKAFVKEFGADALLAVKCLGDNVGNIFFGIAPVEKYFEYPREMMSLLRCDIDFDGETESKPEPGQEPVKATDPLINPADPASIKTAGEIEANSEIGEFPVSLLEVSDSIKEKLFENEIGTTDDVMERHAGVGFSFLTEQERREVLIATAKLTNKEVVVD